MNLQVSYNWLKEYVALKDDAFALAKKLSLHGPSVEKVVYQGENLDKIYVGQVVAIKPHPNADRLKLVTVDFGRGKREVVCGGTNLKESMLVAFADLGAKVRWHGQGEPVKLAKANIRGIDSAGMICSGSEIGLPQFDPAGESVIADLSFLGEKVEPCGQTRNIFFTSLGRTSRTAPTHCRGWCGIKIGTPLAQALNLDDYLLEAEVTSNRTDCLSIIGLAREAAAITNSKFLFTEPKLPSNLVIKKNQPDWPLKIAVKDKKLCPRYQAVVLTGVEIKSSPAWLQSRLQAAGIRPINNIVDVTNYVMLEYGQPMHAFDYDKLAGQQIIVRTASPSLGSIGKIEQGKIVKATERYRYEKILALDGQTYNLQPGMLVIADSQKPIAIAGVMGGEETAVTAETKNIVFESANFEPTQVRKTARALNLFSDSQIRFEKSLSPRFTELALLRAINLTTELTTAKVVSKVYDINKTAKRTKEISLSWVMLFRYLGQKLPAAKVKRLLTALGLPAKITKKEIKVQVPYWREKDLTISEDLVEEIARLYGYHNLPTTMMGGQLPCKPKKQELVWPEKAKDYLVGFGLTELLTYSLVPAKYLKAIKVSPQKALALRNPWNEDLVYLRPNLVPSVLEVLQQNQAEFPEQKVFELSRVYKPKTENDLPQEELKLVIACLGEKPSTQFKELKGRVQALLRKLNLDLTKVRWQKVKPITDITTTTDYQVLFATEQVLKLEIAGQSAGYLGVLNSQLASTFDLKRSVALAYLDFKTLITQAKVNAQYKPFSEFPKIQLDSAFLLDQQVTWEQLQQLIMSVDQTIVKGVELFDVFTGQGIPARKKSIAFHVIYQAEDRTLKQEEADKIQQQIIDKVESQLGGKLRDV